MTREQPTALAQRLQAHFAAQGKDILVRYVGGGWIAYRARTTPGPEITFRTGYVRAMLDRAA